MRISAGLLLAVLCTPAHASAGLSCEAKDKAAEFTLEGGVTHGMGSPLFSFRGEVDIKAAGIPEDLRDTAFERDHVAQYWLDGEELRLLLYREREGSAPHGYVELTIVTKADGDDIGFSGRYELTVFDAERGDDPDKNTTRMRGKVTCGVG